MRNYLLLFLLILLVSCKEKTEYQPVVCPELSDEDVAYWIPFDLNDTLTFINDSNTDTMMLLINSYNNWAGEGRCGGCEATREMKTTIDPAYRIAVYFMVYKVRDGIDYYFRFGKFEAGVPEFNYNDAIIKESFGVADSLNQFTGYPEQTESNGIVYENSIYLIPTTESEWIDQVYVVPYIGLIKFRDSQTNITWERVI